MSECKEEDIDHVPVKRGRGRPKDPNRLMTRAEWEKEQKKAKGRPPGIRTAIKKFEERLVKANKIEGVIDKIVDAALNDDHKHQAAAWKMILDRMAPQSHYEKGNASGKPMVQINVSSVSQPEVVSGETIDNESFDNEPD